MDCYNNSATVWKITAATSMTTDTSTIPAVITATTSLTSNIATGTNSE